MQRHRHQEFMRFLNAIEAEVPAGKMVHVYFDNYAATSILRSAPGSTGTSASSSTSRNLMLLAQCGRGLLRQAVQAPLETRRLPLRRRPPGRHQPLPRRDQRRTKPFTWTADPDKIIAAVRRGHRALNSIH